MDALNVYKRKSELIELNETAANILWNWFWPERLKTIMEIMKFCYLCFDRTKEVYPVVDETFMQKFLNFSPGNLTVSAKHFVIFLFLLLNIYICSTFAGHDDLWTGNETKSFIVIFESNRFRCRTTNDKTNTRLFQFSFVFWLFFFFRHLNLIFRLDEQHCARNVHVVFNILMIWRSLELDRAHFEII